MTMKIAITVDIHHAPPQRPGKTQSTDKAIIQSMMVRVLSREPDLMIVAGDIGESLSGIKWFRNSIKIFADMCQGETLLAALLGNHDIWTNGRISSLELWERVLPEIIEKFGIFYLEKKNLIIDGVAIVGSYLHYDYSSQDYKGLAFEAIRDKFPDLTPEEFMLQFHCERQNFPDLTHEQFYARYKYQSNNDGEFLNGLPPDPTFAKQIGRGFCERLQAAEDDPAVHSIVIVTHVACMPSQITRHPYNLKWSIGTPYFGNISHSEFILGLTKVKHIISGHTHNKMHSMVTFNDGHEVPVQVIEAEYGNPSAIMIEV